MARIRFTPYPKQMGGMLTDIPAFPEERFGLGIPEAIGDAARTCWFVRISPEWQELTEGVWQSLGRAEGELTYTLTVTPSEEVVDIHVRLTNESPRPWAQSLAFNCFSCGSAASIRDHECVRHWARTGGEFKRLIEIPRQFGPRPTIQLYSVEGAPRGRDIPFVANFQATPDVVLEGWLAIQSRDGQRLAAVASQPALFLFQNMEYSCIHSSPSLGALAPGETGEALTRIYFVESTLEAWYDRLKAEWKAGPDSP